LLGLIPLLCVFGTETPIESIEQVFLIPLIFMVSALFSVPTFILVSISALIMLRYSVESETIKTLVLIITLASIFGTFYLFGLKGTEEVVLSYSLGAILAFVLIFFNRREQELDELSLIEASEVESTDKSPREG